MNVTRFGWQGVRPATTSTRRFVRETRVAVRVVQGGAVVVGFGDDHGEATENALDALRCTPRAQFHRAGRPTLTVLGGRCTLPSESAVTEAMEFTRQQERKLLLERPETHRFLEELAELLVDEALAQMEGER